MRMAVDGALSPDTIRLWQTGFQANEHVWNERSERQRLLKTISVQENGVAVCTDEATNTIMKLAAVTVDKAGASLVKLSPSLHNRGQLEFPVPRDRPVNIGWFIGYAGSFVIGACLRDGEYPGIPLTTVGEQSGEIKELPVEVKGIKLSETDEDRWAGEVQLSKLGFERYQRRGLFSIAHWEYGAETINRSRILSTPDNWGDRLGLPQIGTGLFQILGYTPDRIFPEYRPVNIRPDMYRPEVTVSAGTEYSTAAEINHDAGNLRYLLGAFEVQLVGV